VQDLSKELFDLVNNEYEDFLTVGSTLKGGDDRIEEVRVGVLGFRREVESVKDAVKVRGSEVRDLVGQRRETRTQIALGRQLLVVDERLAELETRMHIRSRDDEHFDDDDEDEEDDVSEASDSNTQSAVVARLGAHIRLYLEVRQTISSMAEHPFLDTLETRLSNVRNILSMDLAAALKQARAPDKDRDSSATLLKVVELYRQLGEGKEAIRILKAS